MKSFSWIPSDGILFHGDLIEAPEGVARKGANAETTMHLADFIRRQGWQVKVFGGVHGFLNSPEEFSPLVQMPLHP